jgi:hypothetical protein
VTPELAMGLVDGCPECVRNTEAPRSAVAVTGGWRTAYMCADCGHAWTTDWAEKALVQSQIRGDSWDNWDTSKDGPARCANTVIAGPRRTTKEFD